jgi:8-oxo-dGTP diphosphatase
MDSHHQPASKPLGVAGRAIIVRADGRILLVLRSSQASVDPGFWELPGGKLSYGETLHDALLREVHEETALSVELGPVVHIGHREVQGFWTTVVVFRCFSPGRNVQISEEHDDCGWFTQDDLAALPLAPGTAQAIQAGMPRRQDHG